MMRRDVRMMRLKRIVGVTAPVLAVGGGVVRGEEVQNVVVQAVSQLAGQKPAEPVQPPPAPMPMAVWGARL